MVSPYNVSPTPYNAIRCALLQGVERNCPKTGSAHLGQGISIWFRTQRRCGCLILVEVQTSCLGTVNLKAVNATEQLRCVMTRLIRFRNMQPLISLDGEETLLP